MYCRKCGMKMSDTDKFCPACGEPVEPKPNSGFDFNAATETAKNKFNEINDTNDHTSEFDPQDIADNKVISIFAYMGVLILIPLLGAKNSRFAKFHVSQGVNLIIANLVITALSTMIEMLFGAVPVLGIVSSIAVAALSILALVLTIIGIVNALNEKAKELPIIGSWDIVKY